MAVGAEDATRTRFFDEPAKGVPAARAVMVDMEPKVITSVADEARRSGVWQYPPKQHFCHKRGAGNNWAMGYNEHGEAAAETVLELVATEAEKCDRLEGFVIPMSVAGGTGSGVGTRLTEGMRDLFPHSIITNQVIWPYSSGEVIVQNYNAMLSLAHLHQHSDAITLIENDAVHEVCARMMQLKTVSFDLMNQEIAKGLEGMLRPAVASPPHPAPGPTATGAAAGGGGGGGGRRGPGAGGGGGGARGAASPTSSSSLSFRCASRPTGRSAALQDLVATLCPNPDFKLLTVRRVPQMPDKSREFTTYKWPGLLKTLRQMLVTNSPCEEGINWRVKVPAPGAKRSPYFNTSIANLLVLRGSELETADPAPFADPALYAPWSADPVAVWASSNPGSSFHEKSATLISNSYSVVHPVQRTVAKAWDMYAARAFVHQYQQHGVSEDDFVGAFAKVEQIVANYAGLAPPRSF